MPKSKEFQYLVELVDIVNRHKIKQIEVIGNPKSSHIPISRYWEFYEQMVDDNFKNDHDAMAFFSLEDNERSYKKLRLGLQDRLLNTLFFIDLDDKHIDDYTSTGYQLWKKLSALIILRSRGARTLTMEVAEDILKKSLKYQFSEISYQVAEILKNFYALDPTKQQKYEKYNTIMWQQFKIREVELRVLEYYQRSILPYIKDKSPKKQMTLKMKNYVQEMEDIPADLKSEQFLRICFILKIYIPLSEYNWKETVLVANKAIDYYEKHPHFPKKIISLFLLQKILAEIMLKQYAKAQKDVLYALEYVPTNSKSWFKLKELEGMVYLHNAEYKSAWDLIKKIVKHKRFSSLPETSQETWFIYNAYISFVQFIGKVNLSPREKGVLKQFRLSKFINEVPIFSKDKRGMNISILIVQILLLLYEEKYDELGHKIDALMKYKERKLVDVSQRTEYFIKIMQTLQRGNYQKEKVIRKATPYFEKLNKIEMDLSRQGTEFEVIPYPRLWDYTIEILDGLKGLSEKE